jgi:hypothetical protein
MDDFALPAPFPPQVCEKLQETYLRLKGAQSAKLLWELVLTPAEKTRLGGDLETAFAAGGAVGMWVRLHGVSVVRAVIDVARALNYLNEVTGKWLLRETGESVDDPEDIPTRVAPTAELVLVERPRQAYWLGTAIPIEWDRHNAFWTYLWELATHAKLDEPLDRFAFSAEYAQDYLAKLKSRLSTMEGFPGSLADRITSEGEGTQRLNVRRNQIRLFRVLGLEFVREWDGRS